MLKEIFKQTLEEFFDNETENILSGVSERNLCARLAMSLDRIAKENGITGYYADPEYNRKQNGQVKTILDEQLKIINITCDLILHSRGQILKKDNLIAIEMKKAERPNHEKQSDKARLKTLTKNSFDDIWSADGETHPEHVCGYELGYFIEIDLEKRNYIVEEFTSGSLTQEFSKRF